jgi:hypothetical protein
MPKCSKETMKIDKIAHLPVNFQTGDILNIRALTTTQKQCVKIQKNDRDIWDS